MSEDSPSASGEAPAELLVQARRIEKAYRIGRKPVPVLHGVCLDVLQGECLCIQGASGAGKSTLLHILGGLETPSAGEVLFQGRSLYDLGGHHRTLFRAREVGFVFQAYHLLPELTVAENVLLPAMRLRGDASRWAASRERGNHLLACVGLDHRMHHRPMELSGGEQQRVALARALINEPRLVLADEPTGNLDSHTGEQILKHLFELTVQRGHTLVIVTHDSQVASQGHRRAILSDGLIAF
jgi:ABC-type lipoprotein export system ATPase subunit